MRVYNSLDACIGDNNEIDLFSFVRAEIGIEYKQFHKLLALH